MPADDVWAHGSVRRLGGVTAARLVAQGLGLLWFVLAARSLGADEFGVCAAGLALVFVIGAFSDLGLTRTVAIRVGARPHSARAIFLRATQLRVGAGVIAAVAAMLVTRLFVSSISPMIVLLAGGIALASGITEIGFAVLRSMGRVRIEAALLVGERTAFLAIGATLMARGGGPVSVLGAYLATNLVSALVVAVRLVGRSSKNAAPASRGLGEPVTWRDLADVEERWIAMGSTITVLTPRVMLLLLMAAGSDGDVGRFAAAQKPVEALTAMSVVLAAPVLAMLSGSSSKSVRRRARQFAQLGVTVLAGAAAWLMVSGETAMSAVFGDLATPEVGRAAAVLALAGGLGLCRLVADATLLTEDRSAVSTAVLSLVPIVSGALVLGTGLDRGIGWAAIAVLVGEVSATIAMLVVSHRRAVDELSGTIGWGAIVLVGTLVPAGLVARAVGDASGLVQAAVTAAVSLGVTGGALVVVSRSIERGAAPSAAPRRPVPAARV